MEPSIKIYLVMLYLFSDLIEMHYRSVVSAVIPVEIACPGYVAPVASVALGFTGPAFEEAVEECNSIYAGTFDFSLIFVEIMGGNLSEPRAMTYLTSDLIANWYYRRRKHTAGLAGVITSGGIDYGYTHQLTASWNLLYFSTVGYTKSTYSLSGPPVFATGLISVEALTLALVDLLEMYDWITPFIVVDFSSAPVYNSIFDDIDLVKSQLQKGQRLLPYKRVIYSHKLPSFRPLLEEFQRASRVLVFLGRSDQLRRLLIEAASQHLTNGEFVYICVEPYRFEKNYGNYSWQFHDYVDETARQAFGSLLIVQPYYSSILSASKLQRAQDMGAKFRRRAMQKYNISYTAHDQPLWDVLSSYSTVKMYCQVLNETLHSDGLAFMQDGRKMAEKFLNYRFKDEFSDIYIDPTGIRRTTMIVSHHIGYSRIRECMPSWLQAFLILPQDNALPLQKIPGITMNSSWPDGLWPPPNEPYCGYRYEKHRCLPQSDSPLFIALITSILCITTALLVVFATWRHFRTTRQEETWWNLLPDSIVLDGVKTKSEKTILNNIRTTQLTNLL